MDPLRCSQIGMTRVCRRTDDEHHLAYARHRYLTMEANPDLAAKLREARRLAAEAEAAAIRLRAEADEIEMLITGLSTVHGSGW